MLIKHFTVGPIQTNCYVVACEETLEAVVIDPDLRKKEEINAVHKEITKRKLKIKYIINTHFHADHISGNRILKEITDAKILVHEKDAPLLIEPWKMFSDTRTINGEFPTCPVCNNRLGNLEVSADRTEAKVSCPECGFSLDAVASPQADQLLNDGDVVKFGNLKLQVIHTPGHTPGGISLYCESDGVVFTGDTLFAGSIGRTDLPLSSFSEIKESLSKLVELPDSTIVYAGHGEHTTIGKEKRENPYLKDLNQ
jgi:hydroxyacylglutathione hydrolase